MTSLVKLIDDKLRPGVHGDWDDKIFRERLFNRFPVLKRFRVLLIAELCKTHS